MAVRGQRTQIVLGSLKADVSLVNASGDPSAVRFESARIDRDGNVVTDVEAAEAGPLLLGQPGVPVVDMELTTEALDPLGAGETGDTAPSITPAGMTRDEAEAAGVTTGSTAERDPASLVPDRMGLAPVIPQNVDQALARDAHHGLTEPVTRIVKGVTGPKGFVDLTDRLAEIDAFVKLDGMQVVAAVPGNAVPRERVRNAQFVVPQDPTSQKIVGLLYDALLDSSRAIAVRWSKRTNQALGVLVASKARGCLMLYEVEWGANERKAPAAAVVSGVAANMSDGERKAAVDYIERISGAASALNEVADERRELQGELVEAAKQGDSWTVPLREQGDDDDLAAAISAQAS
jgi:hypothetical protein